MIQLLHILQLSWRFRIVARILTLGAVNFKDLFIQFGLLIWSFTQFYYFHLSAERHEYATAVKTLEAMIALFLGGGSTFKANVAVGEDMTAKLLLYIYGVFIIVAWTNLFIATLVDLFHAASEEVMREAKSETFDPIDYISNKLITMQTFFVSVRHMFSRFIHAKHHTD